MILKRLLLIFALLFPLGLMAQGTKARASKMKGLIINADESDRDTEADTLDLRGHVQIIFKEQHLSCDHARLNFRSKTINAEGSVLVVGPHATVGGEKVFLDYESNTGVIYSGFVQSGNVYFEGQVITRSSETDYVADDAKFTTCTNCPESWSFSGQKIRAELGGYAYIKNSFLRLGGWPVFWLPYLIVPLKSDRQSGLLTPEFEQSDSGGLTLSESYFWAMNRSQDSTWTVKNYELRGTKTLLNYRYMLSEESQGELNVGTLQDRVFASDDRLNKFRTQAEQNQSINRWFLKYEHYYELPDNYIQRLQLNDASDLQYPKDFPLETLNHGDSSMENRMSLTKNTRSQHYSLDSSYYVNMMQYDPLGNNNDAVHRLPELRFSQTMTPVAETGLLYTANLDYTNFARSGFAYDNMNGPYDPNNPNYRHMNTATGCNLSDPVNNPWYNQPACKAQRTGSYDPNQDILRTGQRTDMTGTIYRPIQIGNSLDLMPKLSYRETQYQFNAGEDQENIRRYVRAEIAAKSTFSQIYGNTGPGSFERLKHEIVPEVTYTTIPWISQPPNPFFGTQTETPFSTQYNISDTDINSPYGIQFDYNDRVYDRKLITFALTNKLTQKRWKEGNPEYRQIVSWKVAQSYDFYQAQSANPHREPYSDLISDLRVNLDRLQVYSRADYFPYQQVTNSSNRVRVLNADGDFVEAAYLLSYNITPGVEADAMSRTEDYTFSVRRNWSYVEFLGRLTYDINPPATSDDQKFKSYGYGAQVKLPGNCWYFTVQQYRITGGDNNFKLSFDFIWDGQKKPSLPESILDSFGF